MRLRYSHPLSTGDLIRNYLYFYLLKNFWSHAYDGEVIVFSFSIGRFDFLSSFVKHIGRLLWPSSYYGNIAIYIWGTAKRQRLP